MNSVRQSRVWYNVNECEEVYFAPTTETFVIFTFMLPCLVIDFFLNNRPDAIIIQIYSFIKLYMLMTASKQSQDGTPSWLCLKAVIKNLHETYLSRMYSTKPLIMGRKDARNM